MQIKIGRAFRYQFELTLHHLDVEIPFPCSIQFHWSRNNNKISAPNQIEIKGSEKNIPINAKLTLACTCFLKQSLDFVEKKSVISVTLNINGSQRSGGYISLNLSSILNPLNHKTTNSRDFEEILQKSVLKNGKLKFSLKCIYIKQMLQQDLRQQSTSIASSNPNTITPPLSLNSFNFKDFGDILQSDINNNSVHSVRVQKQSYSISSEKRRTKINSEISDDYDLSQKQKQSVYRLQAENTQLKMFGVEHEKRIAELLQQISIGKQEHEGRIKELNEVVAGYELRLEEWERKQKVDEDRYGGEIRRLQGKIDDNKREYHQDLSQLKRQNSQLQSIITKQEISYQNLQSSSQTNKLNQKNIINQLKQKQTHIQQLQTKIKTYQLQNGSLQKQMDEVIESNVQLKLEIRMIQESNSSVIDNRINELKRKVVLSEDGLKECEEIISVLKKEIKEKNISVAVQEQKIKILDEVIVGRDNEVDELNKVILGRNGLIEQYQRKTKDLQFKNKSLKESIRKYQQFIKAKEDENYININELNQTKAKILHLNKALQSNNLTINSLSEKSTKQQSIISHLTSKIHQLQSSNNPLAQQLSTLQAQNKNLTKTNQLLLQQLAKTKQQSIVQSTKNQNSWLQKIQLLENQIKRRDGKISKLEAENRNLEQDNIKLNIKIMKELNELQKKHTGMKASMGGGNSGMVQSRQLS